MNRSKRMDSEFLLVREAHDLPRVTLRERNDEPLERIYSGRRFTCDFPRGDTVRAALRSKTAGKTLRAIHQNGQPASHAETFCQTKNEAIIAPSAIIKAQTHSLRKTMTAAEKLYQLIQTLPESQINEVLQQKQLTNPQATMNDKQNTQTIAVLT
uniref:DUF2281 domain-containing protein n=1 Tax=Petrachloros mirabilis TaxID=2918835 RepID=UPI001EE7C61A|nr:DUF2281 domain-containing protein [Petrachloros mirabilis]